MTYRPSVQLYSLRHSMAIDIDATLARVAEIGYTDVEPYAFVDSAEPLRRSLAAHGLVATSAHNSVINHTDPRRVFAVAAQLGIATVIDPFIPVERWQRADDIKALAERVNHLAQLAPTEGVAFGYHNHNWELATMVDGRHALELFVEQLADEVVLEVDTFWATVGGADVPRLLREWGDRIRLIHVKDGGTGGDIARVLPSSDDALSVPDALAEAFKQQVPAGKGQVDIASILAAAPTATRVVEFDDYAGDIFEGIEQSLAYLLSNDPQATGVHP